MNLARHPWSHVVIGMWKKYPNPHCSHVKSVDVLERTVDPVTGIIRTERVLGVQQKTPTWILKVSGMVSFLDNMCSNVHVAVIWRLRRCICTGNIVY